MQNTFEIASSLGCYSVTIGRGLTASVFQSRSDALYLVDSKLFSCLPNSVKNCVRIDATEHNKSLEFVPKLITALREKNATRDTHIVAIGGGIIQDIVTFAASIYMRGLSWTYMPTTVLAMVDSCIGGKSSINVGSHKNLVGNFHPPTSVIIDTEYVATLSPEMVVGGLYEAAKICFARDYSQFENYLGFQHSYPLHPDSTVNLISFVLRTKKWFIEVDEFDQKERLLLNFGHTFGHAIEGGTGFGVSHGIAVGVGMLAACHFSRQLGGLTSLGSQRIEHLERHIHSALAASGVSDMLRVPHISMGVILKKFEFDKKHRRDAYSLILPREDGALKIVSIGRNDKSRDAVQKAFRSAFSALKWKYA